MTLTFRNVFAEELRKLLREKIGAITEEIVYGGAIDTIAAYREKVGMIRGLQDAIDLTDEAELNAEEREHGV